MVRCNTLPDRSVCDPQPACRAVVSGRGMVGGGRLTDQQAPAPAGFSRAQLSGLSCPQSNDTPCTGRAVNRTPSNTRTRAGHAARTSGPCWAPCPPVCCTGVPEWFLRNPSARVGILPNLSNYLFLLVGTAGIEPARDLSQRILSPLRLPIPPRPRVAPPRIGWTNRIKVQ